MAVQLSPFLKEVIQEEFAEMKDHKKIGEWKVCALTYVEEGMDSMKALYKEVNDCKAKDTDTVSKQKLEKLIAELSASGLIDLVTTKNMITKPEITELGKEVLNLYAKNVGKHVH